jgi:hypothetical protein
VATATSEKTYDWNGQKVTYTRYKYELARQNQIALDAVNNLLVDDARSTLAVAKDYGQQEMGGFLREVVPGMVDKYGKVNATVAMKYYQESRDFWFKNIRPQGLSRDAARGRETRYATKKTQGALQYTARMAQYDLQAKTEPIIGYAMKSFMGDGFDALESAATNAMTRAVASYHRDTILFNAGLDDAVYGVQRVARADACAFCAMMAFSSERTYSGAQLDVRVADYAIDFHDHCNCTIETLYIGDKPIRPDYYDKFEEDYNAASALRSSKTDWNDRINIQDHTTGGKVDQSSLDTAIQLSAMRQVSGRK